MSAKNNLFGWLTKLVVAGLLTLSAASVATAQTADPSRGLWLAISANEASLAGRGFGRLTMVDGVLAYRSTNFEWRLKLAEIKRVGASKALDNALEVESTSGEIYFVGILDGQLTLMSPGKAAQIIQRAVKTAPAPAAARVTMVAGGSLR